jgi:UDP:flavonoid glycosyltransferase YjiC (YdhE family)
MKILVAGWDSGGGVGAVQTVVGLSSTVMRPEGLQQRAAEALGQLPARGLVTTGPAIARVTDDPRYRAAARRMAARLAAERDDNHAVDELEEVAAGRPAAGAPARR